MSTDVARIEGVRGHVLYVSQCGVSRELGVGLQITPDGRHGGGGYAILDANGVAKLIHALSLWLASAHPGLARDEGIGTERALVEAEREACADIADRNNTDDKAAGEIAREIRARGA